VEIGDTTKRSADDLSYGGLVKATEVADCSWTDVGVILSRVRVTVRADRLEKVSIEQAGAI
jgi:hypothetical protein